MLEASGEIYEMFTTFSVLAMPPPVIISVLSHNNTFVFVPFSIPYLQES